METLSQKDFVNIYNIAVKARRYERQSIELSHKPFLQRFFSMLRPPVSELDSAYKAEVLLNKALTFACPNLNGYVAGPDGPDQYKIETKISFDSKDNPVLNFLVTDELSHKYSAHTREFYPGYGMIAMYQHCNNPEDDRRNRNHAASRESYFEADCLKQMYYEYRNLCSETLCKAQKNAERSAASKSVSASREEAESLKTLNGISDRNLIASYKKDVCDYVSEIDGYFIKSLDALFSQQCWLKTTADRCMRDSSLNTAPLREAFQSVRNFVNEYMSSDQFMYDAVHSVCCNSDTRKSLRQCRAEASVSHPASFAYEVARRGFLEGYSDYDIRSFLISENIDFGQARDIDCAKNSVMQDIDICLGCRSVIEPSVVRDAVKKVQSASSKVFITQWSVLINNALQAGNKLTELAAEAAAKGFDGNDFITAASDKLALTHDTVEGIRNEFFKHSVETVSAISREQLNDCISKENYPVRGLCLATFVDAVKNHPEDADSLYSIVHLDKMKPVSFDILVDMFSGRSNDELLKMRKSIEQKYAPEVKRSVQEKRSHSVNYPLAKG